MSGDTTADADAGAEAREASDVERKLRALAERLEQAVQDAVETAKVRSRPYAEGAGERMETAQKYVIDQVQERPLAATFAALGVGVLIGLLIAGRRG